MSGYTDSAKFNSNASYYVEASPFTGGETVAGNLTVSGAVTAGDGLTVTGAVAITGNSALTGTLSVSGLTTATGGVTASNLTSTGALTVTGATSINGTLTANAGVVANSLTVLNNSFLNGVVTAPTIATANITATGGITAVSETLSGALSAATIGGAWAGTTIPAVPMGGIPLNTGQQNGSFVVGNTRITFGSSNEWMIAGLPSVSPAPSNTPVLVLNFTPFSNANYSVYISPAVVGGAFVSNSSLVGFPETVSRIAVRAEPTFTGNCAYYWLVIGPA